MSEEFLIYFVPALLGLLVGFLERRDGHRLADVRADLQNQIADLRERVATLEASIGE